MTQAEIKALIDEKITSNGAQEITGEVLNDVLQEIADACGYTFDIDVYPADAAIEVTFYNPDNPDGVPMKINAEVSNLGNSKLEAISAWWAAQTERKLNKTAGYDIDLTNVSTSPSTLGVTEVIEAGQIIQSFTGASKLIFGATDATNVTVNSTDLPYTATKTLYNVKLESGTAANLKITVANGIVSVSQNTETGEKEVKVGDTVLPIENEPKAGSKNPVSSGGVDSQLMYKADKLLRLIENKGIASATGEIVDNSNYVITQPLPIIDGYGYNINVTATRCSCYNSPIIGAASFIGNVSAVNDTLPGGTKYVVFTIAKTEDLANIEIISLSELSDKFGYIKPQKKGWTKYTYLSSLYILMNDALQYMSFFGTSVNSNVAYTFMLQYSSDNNTLRVVINDANPTKVYDNTFSIVNGKIDAIVGSNAYKMAIKADLNVALLTNFQIESAPAQRWEVLPKIFNTLYPDLTNINTQLSNVEKDVEALKDGYDDLTVERTIYSDNLFNKDAIVNGSLKTEDGTITDNANYVTSDYMPVIAGKTYRSNALFRCACFYNENKVYLGSSSAISSSSNSVNPAPAGAAFVRISIANTYYSDTYTFAQGSTPIPYVPYKTDKVYVNPQYLLPNDIILPANIDCCVGDNLQLFLRSIIESGAVEKYNIAATVNVTKRDLLPRYLQINPSASDVGDKIIRLYLRDDFGNDVAVKSTNLHISALPTSPASNINILLVGDSMSAKGYVGYELNRRLTTLTGEVGSFQFPKGLGLNNISFVGRKQGEYTDIHQEATGGRKWIDYTTEPTHYYRFFCNDVTGVERGMVFTNNGISFTIEEINQTENTLLGQYNGQGTPEASGNLVLLTDNTFVVAYTSCEYESANPFWNTTSQKDDFIKYCTDNNISGGIQILVAWMGWNDIYRGRAVDDIKDDIEQFLTWFHNDYPNAKVILPSLWMMSYFGGYDIANQVSTFDNRFHQMIAFNEMLENLANSGTYNNYVYYCAAYCQFDCEYGYSLRQFPVNNRVTDHNDLYAIDEAHPVAPYIKPTNPNYESTINSSPNGYYLLADALFRTFCRILS